MDTIDKFSIRINKFLDLNLSKGKICSIASGFGEREHWLLKNQIKKRIFYASDLFTNKELNKLGMYLNKKYKKKIFVSNKKPVSATKLPYKNHEFDSIYSGSVLFALSNNSLSSNILFS